MSDNKQVERDKRFAELRTIAEAQLKANQVLDQLIYPQDVLELLDALQETQAQLDSCRPDANLFSMLRAIVSFNRGVFLLKDGDRIAVGVPTESICYGALGDGCDEREAVKAAYENMLTTPPCELERVDSGKRVKP